MENARKFGEIFKGPDHIGLDITNRCNMCCQHCYNRSNVGGGVNVGGELSEMELSQFSEELRILEPPSFCFCGGEPLLRYDMVLKMLDKMHNQVTHPGLVTNGFLMTLEKAYTLKEHGLYTYQVSIDGANASTHDKLRGRIGCYERALAAVEMGYDVGMPFRAVAFSPTRFNIEQFPMVVEQMYERHVNEIRVQPLMRLGTAIGNENIFPERVQYHWLHQQILRLQERYPKMKLEWGDPIDHLFRSVEAISHFVPIMTVLADGSIVLSPYLPIVIGSFRRHSLRDYWDAKIWRIWERKAFQEIAQTIQSEVDFSREDVPVPRIFYSPSVHLDLIDDRLLEISDADLWSLYWNRVTVDEKYSPFVMTEIDPINKPTRERYVHEMIRVGMPTNTMYLCYGKSRKKYSINTVKSEIDEILMKNEEVGCSTSIQKHRIDVLTLDNLSELMGFVKKCQEEKNLKEQQYVRNGEMRVIGSALTTRYRMFNETHYYFVIRDNEGSIGCCLGVQVGIGDSVVVFVNMLLGDLYFYNREKFLERLFEFVENYMTKEIKNKVLTKLRFTIASDQVEIEELLKSCRFEEEAVLSGSRPLKSFVRHWKHERRDP